MPASNGGESIRRGRRNDPWVSTPQWVVFSGISAPAQALYTALNAHVNEVEEDDVAFPGMDTLAAILGYRRRQSIARYLDELVKIGAISVERIVHMGKRRNVYTVHDCPEPGYTGPRSMKEFYARRAKQRAAAQRAATKGMCATAHQPMCAPADIGMCAPADKNKTDGTRRSERDEVTPGRHAPSGEDAYQRVVTSQAQRPRASDKPQVRIHIPRGFNQWEPEKAQQKLVACAVAALDKAGKRPTPGSNDALGAWARGQFEDTGRSPREIARDLETLLVRAFDGDKSLQWLIGEPDHVNDPFAPVGGQSW